VLAATVCAALLALAAIGAPAALAGPADQYKLRGFPNGGDVGNSGGGSGVIVLVIAAAVIVVGVGALVYVKRRGKAKEAT
jgi:hypothetical protein